MVHYRQLWRGRRRSTNSEPATSRSEPLTGTDLLVYSQTHLNKAARQLNERPRKTLAFETPAVSLTPVLRRPVEPAGVKRTRNDRFGSLGRYRTTAGNSDLAIPLAVAQKVRLTNLTHLTPRLTEGCFVLSTTQLEAEFVGKIEPAGLARANTGLKEISGSQRAIKKVLRFDGRALSSFDLGISEPRIGTNCVRTTARYAQ